MRRRDVLALPWLWPLMARADATAPVPVVASFTILADLVREVGGPVVEVHTLVGPDSDAHVYQPTPRDARAVARASLVVFNGLGFEGWMDRLLLAGNYNGPLVEASHGIVPRRIDGVADPHAWQDPRLVERYVANIESALTTIVPASAAAISASTALYRQALRALDGELRAAFDTLPPDRRRVITSHDAFGYLGEAYGLEFLPLQGWSTESEPRAADLARLVRLARERGAAAAFVENISDPRLIRALSSDTGLAFGGSLYSDALATPGRPADTYLGMMRHNAATLLAALRPLETQESPA